MEVKLYEKADLKSLTVKIQSFASTLWLCHVAFAAVIIYFHGFMTLRWKVCQVFAPLKPFAKINVHCNEKTSKRELNRSLSSSHSLSLSLSFSLFMSIVSWWTVYEVNTTMNAKNGIQYSVVLGLVGGLLVDRLCVPLWGIEKEPALIHVWPRVPGLYNTRHITSTPFQRYKNTTLKTLSTV